MKLKKVWLDFRLMLIDRAYKKLGLTERQFKELKALAQLYDPVAFSKYRHDVHGRVRVVLPFQNMGDLNKRLLSIHHEIISHRLPKENIATCNDREDILDNFFITQAGMYRDPYQQVGEYFTTLAKICIALDEVLVSDPAVGLRVLRILTTLFGRLKYVTSVFLKVGIY